LIALADDIQAVSVDEAIIEVTNVIEDFKSRYLKAHPTMTVTEIASHDFAKQYAEFLRYQIKDLTGCESRHPCS
jgi:DNA repair protein REV1